MINDQPGFFCTLLTTEFSHQKGVMLVQNP